MEKQFGQLVGNIYVRNQDNLHWKQCIKHDFLFIKVIKELKDFFWKSINFLLFSLSLKKC